MSYEATDRVWHHSQAKGSARCALLALAFRADAVGVCWPGLDEIATRTNVTRRHAIRLIQKLRASGELYFRGAAYETGRRASNRYFVVVGLDESQIARVLTEHEQFGYGAERAAGVAREVVERRTSRGDDAGVTEGVTPTSGGDDACVRREDDTDVRRGSDTHVRGEGDVSVRGRVTPMSPESILEPIKDEPKEESAAAAAAGPETAKSMKGALEAYEEAFGELSAAGRERFRALWDEHPDPEAHAYAREEMAEVAQRPNLRYYAECLETAAVGGDVDEDARRRRRYIEGKYSDWIEH